MRRLFWDLEVSPNVLLSWRVGREVSLTYDNIIKERAIISAAWKWEGEKKVHAKTWSPSGQQDGLLVETLVQVLNEADESVAHFGDSFDLKWLRGRALFHGIPMMPKYKTVDTCKISRKHFYLNSHKLDYLAQYLGLGGKLETTYGLWKKVMLDKCPKALAEMVKYNKVDVELLEKVYHKLAPYAPHVTHAAVLAGGEKRACAHCASPNVQVSKTRVTAAGTVQKQMQCRDCGRYYSISQQSHDKWKEAHE